MLNDLAADSKGGAYFTMGALFYASSSGKVTKYGDDLHTNGIILSTDEKTLYVTNGKTVAAFDVQPDGSLTNEREFGKLEGGGFGDGSTIDAAGRIYVTTGSGRSGARPRRQVSRLDSHPARSNQRSLLRPRQENALHSGQGRERLHRETKWPTPHRSTRFQ